MCTNGHEVSRGLRAERKSATGHGRYGHGDERAGAPDVSQITNKKRKKKTIAPN